MKEPHGGCEQTACQTTFDVIGPPSGAWPTGPISASVSCAGWLPISSDGTIENAVMPGQE